MIDLDRKTKILMISVMLVLAVLTGIAALAYANGLNNDTMVTNDIQWNNNGFFMGAPRRGGGRGFGCEPGSWGSLTVSQEFKDKVLAIANKDTDVQSLLNDGYNVTAVRPIINATVEGDGTVTLKATSAAIMLEKGTTGRVSVWVNLEEEKVTRIEILTRAVIEKP